MGLPVLRTLSLCTCCRHYPGAAAGRMVSLGNPAVSAFPERVIGSACASSFSLARRSLALRPAHSRCHQFVTRFPRLQPLRHLHSCSGCFRLERSPGGTCTHWKAPPCHGAHPIRTLAGLRNEIINVVPATSFRLDPEFLDERPQFLGIGLHERAERLWGLPFARNTVQTEIRETRSHDLIG
jgi:hypothetical protein